MKILYIAIGFCSGIISGMGIGGGAILIPALIMLCGLDQHQAQNTNLIYFIPTAVIALCSHFKRGNIEKTVLPRIIVFGIGGAVMGSLIAINMRPELLRKIFGFFFLTMGLYEFFYAAKKDNNEHNNEGNSIKEAEHGKK